MKKVLCVIRVSTIQQEMASQRADMERWLASLGYHESEIEWLEAAGASARSLNRKYIEMIETIKSIVLGSSIRTVALWHINRLGRREKMLIDMKEWFIQNRVQLHVKNPELRLLDGNGEPDKAGGIVYSLFANMVESETEEMMMKMSRGKALRKSEGRFTGASLPMGYCVDEGGYIRLDEEEAEVVRLMFSLYASGDYSTTSLARELSSRGLTNRGHAFSPQVVRKMLSKRAYLGETGLQRIVSDEVFAVVEQKRRSARMVRKTNYPSAYLCNRLIVCPCCGYHFSASDHIYRCFKYAEDRKARREGCTFNVNISISTMDFIAWRVAESLEVARLLGKDRESVDDLRKQLAATHKKMETVRKSLSAMPLRREKVMDMYTDGLISREKLREKVGNIDKNTAGLQADADSLQAEADRLLSLIADIEHPKDYVGLLGDLHSGMPTDNAKMREIVRRHIVRIDLSDWREMQVSMLLNPFKSTVKDKKYLIITVHTRNKLVFRYRFFPRWGFGTRRLEEEIEDGSWQTVGL